MRAFGAQSDIVVDLSELVFADTSLMLDLAMLSRRIRRRGGAILGTMGKRAPVGRLGISNRSQRWREFAALSDERFEAKIAGLAHRYPSGVRRYRKQDQPTTGPVVTSITAWQVDEAGCMSRSLVAAGETPPLKGEGHPPSPA